MEDDLRSLMFCDFSNPKADFPKPYVEVKSMEKLRLLVESCLDEYNNMSKKPMNLVMFRYLGYSASRKDLKFLIVSWSNLNYTTNL